MSATTGSPMSRPVRAERGPRGRIWLYAIAFVLLLLAGWFQAKGNLLAREDLVKTSIAISIAATLVAVVSVLVPGPRARAARVRSPKPAAPAVAGNGGAAASVAAADAEVVQPAAQAERPAEAVDSAAPEEVADRSTEEPSELEPAGDVPAAESVRPDDGPRTAESPDEGPRTDAGSGDDRRAGPPA